jgi:hypothetical protein
MMNVVPLFQYLREKSNVALFAPSKFVVPSNR